jgi:hypothetical protein
MASSVVPQYGVMEHFEESAQEPTVRCNIQPATQPTGLSDFQLNDSNSSKQSTVASSDFPTVFPHEPLPSTSATPIDSTG